MIPFCIIIIIIFFFFFFSGNKDSGKCPDCKAGDLNWAGNGEVTGNCQEKATYCDVKGWCPVEVSSNFLPRFPPVIFEGKPSSKNYFFS